jgi:septation ring formation regulator EzrA
MKEAEFDERLKEIKKDLEELYNHPLVHLYRKTDEGVVPYQTTFGQAITRIAANINQLEQGIKTYNRPSNWDLIEEGITDGNDLKRQL